MNDEGLCLIAQETGLPVEVIKKVYKEYWRTIRNLITQVSLRDIDNEDEFKKLRVNFNIPSLGKLCCTEKRFSNMKKRFKYIEKIKHENIKDK